MERFFSPHSVKESFYKNVKEIGPLSYMKFSLYSFGKLLKNTPLFSASVIRFDLKRRDEGRLKRRDVERSLCSLAAKPTFKKRPGQARRARTKPTASMTGTRMLRSTIDHRRRGDAVECLVDRVDSKMRVKEPGAQVSS